MAIPFDTSVCLKAALRFLAAYCYIGTNCLLPLEYVILTSLTSLSASGINWTPLYTVVCLSVMSDRLIFHNSNLVTMMRYD